MSCKMFGTDGVRGRVGEEPITPGSVVQLGWAAGRVLGRGGPGKILIGKDTRVSGYMLESALEAGLSAAGVDISLIGPMPTPGIAYLTRAARATAGIVISASHNPFEDNGIKFFSAAGYKLPDDVELAIERAMDDPMVIVPAARLGKAQRFPDAAGRYIEYCKSTVPFGLRLNGLKVVVDCANGAAYQVAPSVFEELGADVVAVADQPDGFNINAECGSTSPTLLRQSVLEHDADVGIALDGDGDRVTLVDAGGDCLDGDQLLYVLMCRRQATGVLRGGVVGTLMTNFGLEHACRSQGIPFARTAIGDRYVLERMLREAWELGGETSGHVICLDKSTTGDGIIAALEALQTMVESGRALAELKRGLDTYPQTLINVRIDGDRSFAEHIEDTDSVRQAVHAARSELADQGRVVLRRSGTEPVIRVMVEGREAEAVARIGERLAQAVRAAALSIRRVPV